MASCWSGPTAPLPMPRRGMASTGVARNRLSTRFVLSFLRAACTAASREDTSKSCRKIFRVIFSWSLEDIMLS